MNNNEHELQHVKVVGITADDERSITLTLAPTHKLGETPPKPYITTLPLTSEVIDTLFKSIFDWGALGTDTINNLHGRSAYYLPSKNQLRPLSFDENQNCEFEEMYRRIMSGS